MLVLQHSRSSRHALPLALAVSVATFWKTVFYFLMFSAFVGGDKYRYVPFTKCLGEKEARK